VLGAWAFDRVGGACFRVGPPGTAFPVEFEQLSQTEDGPLFREQLEARREVLIKAIERVVLARAYQEGESFETAVPNPEGEGSCSCSIRVASTADVNDNQLMRQLVALINETHARSMWDLVPRAGEEDCDCPAEISRAVELEVGTMGASEYSDRSLKTMADSQRRRGDPTRHVNVEQLRAKIAASNGDESKSLLIATAQVPGRGTVLVGCVCATTNFKGQVGRGQAGSLAVASGWEQTGLGARILTAAEGFCGFHDCDRMQLEYFNVCEPGWGSRPFYTCELMREWYTAKMKYLEQEVVYVSRQWGEVKCRENLNFVIATRDISEYLVTNLDLTDVQQDLEKQLKSCEERLDSPPDSGVVNSAVLGKVEVEAPHE